MFVLYGQLHIHGIWNYIKNATNTQILRYLVTQFFFLPKKSNSTLITPNKVVGILNNFRMKGIQQLFGPNVIQFWPPSPVLGENLLTWFYTHQIHFIMYFFWLDYLLLLLKYWQKQFSEFNMSLFHHNDLKKTGTVKRKMMYAFFFSKQCLLH